jgi:hypothetical protein
MSILIYYLSKILAKGRDSLTFSCHVHLVTCNCHVHSYILLIKNTCYVVYYVIWLVNLMFFFRTCRMCMKDELVDLPVLGSHGTCIMNIWTCYALFLVMELVLCTYLWSIMHVFEIYYAQICCMMQICCCDATAIGFDENILLFYFMCRDSCKYNQNRKKSWALHMAKEPNILYRVLANGKGATRRQPVCLGGCIPTWEQRLAMGHTWGARQNYPARHAARWGTTQSTRQRYAVRRT